ncbi:hypothetical protein A5761_27100 [Mycolicibacterium setense]|nr:hypothetical protein A5761_27100 [Mycolicibacterium setense]
MATVAAGLISTAAPAFAHATVIASTPRDGAQLDASPPALSFDLSEPVTLVEGSTQLIDAGGTRHALAAPRLEDGRKRIVVQLAEELSDGAYLATARVVSADTHVVSLSIRFTVGAVTGQGHWSETGGESAVDRTVLLPIKILVYLGTIGSAGVFLAARWTAPDTLGTRRLQLLYRWGAGVLALGLIGRFTVLAAEQAGGMSGISRSAVTTVLGTPFGAALLISAALSLAIVRPPSRGRMPLGFLQSAATIIAVTLGGHGGSTDLWPLPFALTALHVYAVSVWLGGLGILAFLSPSEPMLRRRHRVAVGHVALVVIAGIGLALLQVSPLAALVTTSYGVALIVKIGLVLAALVAGYLVYRTRSPVRTRLLLIEIGLALLIIGTTSTLSSLTPARDSYTTDVATRLDFGRSAVLEVAIDTVRRGSQLVTVAHPGSGDSTPQLDVELSSAQANVARLPVELSSSRSGDGAVTWRSVGLIVPSPGRWKVTVRFDDGTGPKLASFYYQVL